MNFIRFKLLIGFCTFTTISCERDSPQDVPPTASPPPIVEGSAPSRCDNWLEWNGLTWNERHSVEIPKPGEPLHLTTTSQFLSHYASHRLSQELWPTLQIHFRNCGSQKLRIRYVYQHIDDSKKFKNDLFLKVPPSKNVMKKQVPLSPSFLVEHTLNHPEDWKRQIGIAFEKNPLDVVQHPFTIEAASLNATYQVLFSAFQNLEQFKNNTPKTEIFPSRSVKLIELPLIGSVDQFLNPTGIAQLQFILPTGQQLAEAKCRLKASGDQTFAGRYKKLSVKISKESYAHYLFPFNVTFLGEWPLLATKLTNYELKCLIGEGAPFLLKFQINLNTGSWQYHNLNR